MPRKKRTIVEETLPDKPETADDNITDYVCVLTKVYRLTNGERFFCFQTDVPVDEMSIANQFPAGGKFIAIEHNAEGNVLDTRAINIEAMGTNAQSNGNGNGHHSEISMLRDELLFARSMTLKMIEGLFNKQNQPQQTPVAELIAGLQGLHALSGTGKDPYDMMVKGIELANKYGGNGGGSGDLKEQLIDAAKQILPPVINAFGSSRQAPPMMTTTGAQPPMIQQSPDTMLREGLKWLKTRIIAGQMSPDFAAEMLIQFGSTDERYQPILKTAIAGTIDDFIAVDVEIGNQPYRDWFTAAIKTVKEWYAEQNNNDSDMDGTSGNNADTTPNA